MKKVLLAFDGEHFSQDSVEFVRQMNLYQPVLAVGVFLPAVEYAELLYSFSGVPSGPLLVSEVVPGNEAVIQKNIALFKTACAQAGITSHIHREPLGNIADLLHEETRFADLLVLSGKSFYEDTGEVTREDYIENVLHRAGCPVVLVPEAYKEPQNIILTYDGGDQSAYAARQFSYLFPCYKDLPALLVHFAEKGKNLPVRPEALELLKCHYKHLTTTTVAVNDEKDIEEWILANKDPMVVAGAYGRRMLSQLFKKSFITDIVRSHRMPIFVAHR